MVPKCFKVIRKQFGNQLLNFKKYIYFTSKYILKTITSILLSFITKTHNFNIREKNLVKVNWCGVKREIPRSVS